MKVVHINASQTGGAALCAKRIMDAESNLRINCRMITTTGNPDEKTAVLAKDPSFWDQNYILRKAKNQFIKLGLGNDCSTWNHKIDRKLCRHEDRVYYHVPISSFKNLVNHSWIQEADLIHLHWVSGMLDYPSFFKHINKPVVWTLHDKYPAVGLQHYSNSEFHHLPDYLTKDDEKCINIKKTAIAKCNDLHIVAISKEMETLCCKSPVLNGLPITRINNGVDTKQFHYQLSSIRDEMKISSNRIVFLFSANGIHDENKGLILLLRALEQLNNPQITIICVGNYKSVPNTTVDLRCVGYIDDVSILSELYSVADYFVLPSYEETFAQTPLEAMACGTPVIAFPVSGVSELINQDNGIICDDYTVDSLISGIMKALNRKYDRNKISNFIENHFSVTVIARQYVDLYQTILNS